MNAESLIQQKHLEIVKGCSTDDVHNAIAQEAGISSSEVAAQFNTYLNEAKVGLRVVAPYINDSKRALEIGGGIGVVSLVLHRAGHHVTDLEPVGLGFDFMRSARGHLRQGDVPPELTISVDDLDPNVHGTYDLIYSVNVLEHVPDPLKALDRVYEVLEPGGVAVFMCPNYAFPFEPHVNRPLIPMKPSMSALIYRRTSQTDIWRSLNWVTARKVKNWANERDCDLVFHRDVVASMITRMTTDEVFRSRHRVLAILSKFFVTLKVDRLISSIPPTWLSPMEFEIRKPA